MDSESQQRQIDFLEKLANVKSRTGMYMLRPSYYVVAAFIEGCDFSTDRLLLNRYHDWLIERYFGGQKSAFVWPKLLEQIADTRGIPVDDEEERIGLIFDVLEQFLRETGSKFIVSRAKGETGDLAGQGSDQGCGP